MIAATFFDGRSTRPHPVTLQVEGNFLHVIGANLRRVEVLGALRFTAAYAHAPSRVDLPGNGSLEIADPQAFLELRRRAGRDRGRVEHLETSLRYALLSVVIIVLAGAAGYIWGIPLAAEVIVDRMPRSYDAQLGGDELKQLARFGMIGPDRVATAREKQLTQRFAQLSQGVGVDYHVVYRSFKGGPNAFALPDGTILVSDQMIALAKDDDAMMFVMAHELGHLRYRHGIKSLARTTLTSIIMSWYVGDLSSALAVTTAGLINLSYSRQAEAQADAFGRKLLHEHGVSTKPAAALFKTLEAMPPVNAFKDSQHEASSSANAKHEAGSSADAKQVAAKAPIPKTSLPSYLNSHPPTEDRARLLEQDQD